MKTVRPPLKLALAAFFLDNQPHSMSEAVAVMQKNYATEKYVNVKTVETALQSLKFIGILKQLDSSATEPCYCISNTGQARVRKALGMKNSTSST